MGHIVKTESGVSEASIRQSNVATERQNNHHHIKIC